MIQEVASVLSSNQNSSNCQELYIIYVHCALSSSSGVKSLETRRLCGTCVSPVEFVSTTTQRQQVQLEISWALKMSPDLNGPLFCIKRLTDIYYAPHVSIKPKV